MALPAKRALSADATTLLRRLPSVDELLLRPRIAALCNSVERGYAVDTVRAVLAEMRREISSGVTGSDDAIAPEFLEKRVVEEIEAELRTSLRPVINASGVILHTNLGRAPLPQAVI